MQIRLADPVLLVEVDVGSGYFDIHEVGVQMKMNEAAGRRRSKLETMPRVLQPEAELAPLTASKILTSSFNRCVVKTAKHVSNQPSPREISVRSSLEDLDNVIHSELVLRYATRVDRDAFDLNDIPADQCMLVLLFSFTLYLSSLDPQSPGAVLLAAPIDTLPRFPS
ncbi:hypothetical protein CERZMDRAFT_93271 [Cercospora zeae-maydis SCOH1-5]|uniref:Uncharacterized protein n=1 Tax=Cercospora zeae-maydis SCOH1-5 TaxID=717836 RepID=A0A6A6FV15_9PEZI|nr:hypothetical protein CERZMDRAFT_93271 [Cercospora zeae-maydis SCOH1-5]